MKLLLLAVCFAVTLSHTTYSHVLRAASPGNLPQLRASSVQADLPSVSTASGARTCPTPPRSPASSAPHIPREPSQQPPRPITSSPAAVHSPVGPEASTMPETGGFQEAVQSPLPTAEQLTSPVQAAGPSAVQDDSDQRPRHGRPEADHHPPEPKRSRLSISSHAESRPLASDPPANKQQQQQHVVTPQVAGQQLMGSEGGDSARQLAGSYSIEQLMQPQAASSSPAARPGPPTAIQQVSNAQADAANVQTHGAGLQAQAGALPAEAGPGLELDRPGQDLRQTAIRLGETSEAVQEAGSPAVQPEVGPWHQRLLQIWLAAVVCTMAYRHLLWHAHAAWHLLPDRQQQCSLICMCHRMACTTVGADRCLPSPAYTPA